MESTALVNAVLLVAWIIISLACGFYTVTVAQAKGYGGSWFFGGFFFWFIALIAIVGMPIRQKQ